MADESTCDRLRKARERLGLTPEEVASRMGLSAPWYYDLEAYPDEVVSTVSLAHLQVLGQTLGLEPVTILVGGTIVSDGPPRVPRCRGRPRKADGVGGA